MLDASIIHLKRTELFRTVIPSKLFESMAMGIPVLLGVEGESADIVKRETVGIAFQPENPEELSQAVMTLADDAALRQTLSRNGTTAAHQFDRSVLARNMLQLLQDAAGSEIR